MDVFEKLKDGEPVDKALFHLDHAEPGSEEQKAKVIR